MDRFRHKQRRLESDNLQAGTIRGSQRQLAFGKGRRIFYQNPDGARMFWRIMIDPQSQTVA